MFPRACVALLAIVNWTNLAFSQQEDDEAAQAATAKRFLQIVEKNPQRGTALEKVFSHHLQMGTLEAFIGELQQRTESDPKDGVGWLLLGLFESQRRMDPAAILAFSEAERLRPNDALPAYYRGQCLLRMGEPTQAADAFEIAIQRKPTRIILLEVFEQLGRTHLRQNRSDLAIDAWTRLEGLFPNDQHVLEQIASIQNQEGDYRNALPRYERLMALAKEPTQRIQYRIETAQLRIRLGNNARGLGELEAILSELKPDGWLYRDVQQKIEEVFLRSNDLAGLVQYYEKKLANSPDDIDSMVRLCKFLVSSGRLADANRWIVHAIERAPSRVDLRKAHIEQLLADKQFASACEQYAQLSQLEPRNADILRDWGKTVLQDPGRSSDEAKKEASQIWNKMIDPSSEQAVVLIQVADLLQAAGIPAEAERLFERAIELEPQETQFREFFGQFLFDQNQRDRAYQVWESIAEGTRRNEHTLMRLAEIYDHAKETEKAVALACEACELVKHDPTLFVKTARFQKKAGKMDDALVSLASAGQLAETEEQRELILHDRLVILEATGRLKSETEALHGQIRQEDKPTLEQWRLLCRYLVRQKRWKEARSAVNQALLLDASNQAMLLASAEIAEGLGNFETSIKSLRKLAGLDRRKRSEYLERIARQLVRQKKFAEAIESAQEVVQAAPTKTESYEFLSQIYFQAKKPDLGIDALRKALRVAPNSSPLTLALGNALATNQQPAEAIEIYWQAFTKANSLNDKIDLSTRMVKVYQKEYSKPKILDGAVPLSELIQRMESIRKDPSQRRDLAICLSHVYQSISDFANAKRTMQELLADQSRDSTILEQFIKLCMAEGDLEMAIDYQRQLIAMAPGVENESYLASLLRQQGDVEGANAIVLKMLQNEPDQSIVLQNLDSLLDQGDYEFVLQILEPLLRVEPSKSELLYRRGKALASVDQWAASRATWEQILTLAPPRTELVLQPAGRANQQGIQGSPLSPDERLLEITDFPVFVDIAQGRVDFAVNQSRSSSQNWSPENVGELRIACIAWLICCDNKDNTGKSDWLRRAVDSAEKNGTRSEIVEAMAISKFRQDMDSQVRIATLLAESNEPEMLNLYLGLLRSRQVSGNAVENPKLKPLSDVQIQLMLDAFDLAREERAGKPLAKANAPQTSYSVSHMNLLLRLRAMQITGQYAVPSNSTGLRINSGGASTPWPNPNVFTGPIYPMSMGASQRAEGFVETVVSELRFAGRAEQAEGFLSRQCDTANTVFQLSSLCEYLAGTQRYREMEKPLLRWFALELSSLRENENDASPTPATVTSQNAQSTQAIQDVDTPTRFTLRLFELSDDQLSKESVFRILDSAIALSNEKFLKRIFPPVDAMALAWHETKPTQKALFVHAWCMNLVSEGEQCLLQLAKKRIAKAGRSVDWSNYLEERVKRAEPAIAALERLRFGLLGEASELSLNDSVAIEALESIGQQSECALQAAKALLSHQKFQAARRVAEAMKPSSSEDEVLQELVVLHASSWLNENSRTQASIEKLASQKLDNATLQSLATPLQRAKGMGIVYPSTLLPIRQNQIVPQVQNFQTPMRSQAATKNTVRIIEMKKLENNGKQADAIRIARQLINQPRIYPSNDGSIAISFVNRSSAPTISRIASRSAISTLAESERLDAFVTLKKHGELEKVIAEAERKAKASPLSFLLQEQLSELYEFAGENVDAEEATLQALKIRPSASSLRIHYLRNLRSTGKTSEACAQFVALVNRDPNCGLSMMAEMLPLFEESGKQSDLLGAVQMAHFQSVTDWDELLMVAYSILGAKNGLEVGCLMFEKLAQLSPQLRQQALTLLLSSEIKKYPRLMNFLLDALIPKENDVIRDPWFGLQDQNASNETGEAIFQKLLTSNRDEEIEKKLEPAVLAAVERMPNWMAGKVMLAMIAVRTNRNLEAKRLIAELASDKRLSVGCPPGVALRLATEFVESPEARKTAINLISPLIGSNNFVEFELAKQPSIVLAKLLIADGQRAKADEVLTREYESGSASVIAYYASSKSNLTGNALAKVPAYADQLLESGLPIESYRLFEKHTDELNIYVPQAMLRKGNLTTREAGQQAAIVLLESLTPDKAIFEILQDRSNPSRNHPALELMLQLSPAAANRNNGIESMIQKTLLRHAVSGKQAEIEAGLQRLLDLYPSDLSILTTQARVRLATGSGDVATTLSEIERIGAAFDTEIARMLSEAKERPASFPVPHFSESIVSTWLIARQCLETDQHVSIADKIANRAWQAASLMDFGKAVPIAPNEITRTNGNTVAKIITSGVAPGQNNLDIASTILSEWGKVLVKQGRTEAGIAKWNELMAKYDLQEKESKQWTTPQFEEQLQLAQLAIDFGQLEVSYDIAKRIARKEPPTPEAPESMRNRPSGFSYQLNRELVMKPSIKALNALLQKWEDKNSPPSVCCDLLLPIIFPNDQGVYLFSDQSRLLHLLHEPPTNLAAKLVDHATRAGRLGDLKQLLEHRNGSVTPIILMTQIAIAEKDYENAKRLLAKLHENYQAGKAIDILAINCQIAIPAFRVEELQEAALPILQELMLREQEVGKHPDASFKRFPLVREVDAYLSAKINRQSESSGKQ